MDPSFSPWFSLPAPSAPADWPQPYTMAPFFPYGDGQSMAPQALPHHHQPHHFQPQEHSEPHVLAVLEPVSLPGIHSVLPSYDLPSNSDYVYYNIEQDSQSESHHTCPVLHPSSSGSYDIYYAQGNGQPAEALPLTRPLFDESEAEDAPPSPTPTPSEEGSWVPSTNSSPSPSSPSIPPPSLRVKEKTKRGRKRKLPIDEEEAKEKETAAPSTTTTQHSLDQTRVFWRVASRLSCIGTQKLYQVTADEIERRISAPEGLTKSILGPLLKRGKIKGCNDELDKLMQERGLSYIATDRRKFPFSTLTGILEEEGEQLSADHKQIAAAHFPHVGIARMMVQGICTPADLEMASEEAQAALEVVSPLVAILRDCLEEGTEGGRRVYSSSSPFRTFSMCTHGLGMVEALLMATILEKFLGVFDHEMREHTLRAIAAAAANKAPLLPDKFPENTKPCVLPDGCLPSISVGEESSHSRSFAEIPGRLTLNNSNSRKYNITVGELYRRVRAPECLTVSTLGSTLRKAKTKANGLSLHNELAKAGVKLEKGRKTTARISCFTSLAEGEALALAQDVQAEVKRSFPFSALATQLNARAAASQSPDRPQRIVELQCASRIAKSLADAILALRLPVAERIPHKVLPSAHLIHSYSCLTHGYGPDAAENWMATFRKVFDLAQEAD